MPRKKTSDSSLTPLELEIMSVLWETGPANVQTVQSHLKTRDLAYTTVQTMLNVLHRKGRVKRKLKDRAYIYKPVLSRHVAMTQAVSDMLDRFFGGSATNLVMNLVETNKLTPEKLASLQQIVNDPASKTDKETGHGNH
jgi:predicted transcriptional regulator